MDDGGLSESRAKRQSEQEVAEAARAARVREHHARVLEALKAQDERIAKAVTAFKREAAGIPPSLHHFDTRTVNVPGSFLRPSRPAILAVQRGVSGNLMPDGRLILPDLLSADWFVDLLGQYLDRRG